MMLRPLAIALLALSLPAYAADPAPQPATQPAAASVLKSAVPPAAHRAVYDLQLESSRGSEINGVSGTMAYELTDACDGWATRQRLTLVITRQGQDIEMVSDYATWESKDGLSMRFRMKQTTDGAVMEQAEGVAKLDAPGGTGNIHYTVPEEKDVAMPAGTVFPMQHTDEILAAAEAGRKFLSIPIFDGTGDKGAQDSSVVIIDWFKAGAPAASPAPDPSLAGMANGRVRIAFFARNKEGGTADKPMGSPDYEVGMRYYANGVANDLHMDFGDFVVGGKLKQFTLQPPHC